MTSMTAIALGFALLAASVLVLVWGFPTIPKR